MAAPIAKMPVTIPIAIITGEAKIPRALKIGVAKSRSPPGLLNIKEYRAVNGPKPNLKVVLIRFLNPLFVLYKYDINNLQYVLKKLRTRIVYQYGLKVNNYSVL